jgi:hypothetical protein
MDLTFKLEHFAEVLEPASILLLLIVLFWNGLQRRYPFFLLYLLFSLLQDVIPLAYGMPLNTNAYAKLFFISEPIFWVLLCLILLELFDLTFADFPGIRSAGRLLLSIAISAAMVVALLTAIPSLVRLHDGDRMLRLYLVLERSVIIVALLMIAALQFLMVHYRLRLPRNTVLYSVTYAVYFASQAFQDFLISEGGSRFSAACNVIGMSINVACLLFLAFSLNRAGTSVHIVAGPRLPMQERDRLRRELEQVSKRVTGSRSWKRGMG